jgi:hypothetical protein
MTTNILFDETPNVIKTRWISIDDVHELPKDKRLEIAKAIWKL